MDDPSFSNLQFTITPLDLTPSELDGLSERLIASHYENNYGGAVRRLNAIRAQLERIDISAAPGFVLNGLKREELIAANSALLHEVYFASLGGRGEPGGALAAALEASFGSVGKWSAEFVAVGKALAGGSGWVVLAWSAREGRLVNQWASDHSCHLADGRTVLALDMYEHAYHIDFGARAGAYVDAFMRNIDWDWVARRYAHVALGAPAPLPHYGKDAMAPEALRDALAAGRTPALIDVRRRRAFEGAADMLPGALWREPERVAEWAADVPRGQEVVVYCVYGHNVSEDVAATLRGKGIRATPLAGGIAAWRAIAAPTQPKKE